MLTETEIRNAKPREKAYKLFDERGLFLLIKPTDLVPEKLGRVELAW